MTDIILEIFRAVIVGGICWYLFLSGKKHPSSENNGWNCLILGFVFVFFGMVIDVTDNFESLNPFIIIGDTPYQAFLEKVVGYLIGFILIAVGFWKWLPQINQLSATQKKLHASQKRYKHLYDSAPVGMYEIDYSTNRFVSVNEQMLRYCGYSREEFFAINPMDLLTENGQKFFREKLITGQNRTDNIGYHLFTKNGNQLNVILSSDFVYNGNKIKGARIVVQDVTEQKRLQDLIVQSEKMISIGGLAAGMAHEINNPLAGMMQNAQVIHNRLTQRLPANSNMAEKLGISMQSIEQYMEQRGIFNQLENINQAGKRAAKIIENVLSFVRKSKPVKTMNQMDTLIDDTIDIAQNDFNLTQKYDIREINIKREYARKMPKVLCEASKIQQVIFNLIKNAAQSIFSHSPKIPLQLTFRLFKELKMAVIEIEDNGPGMDAKTQTRIFEPFFTTKGFEDGTGLGLSVSYFIISDVHGGEMKVESTQGVGTKFIIKLPIE